ncbi:MAG: phage antirepressor KilAC domain-containing protein [Pelatocladus maniniholoensis HA4357-MV3]|jgi:anti-repressor protein|uniref:Phage antirepressor KilAC domain-containing protein n=1 Tax=Pelatocladus maniniholoensis HA4357-MV3 TaxID=1117104 RepID=A0A9E3HAG1_9NOST|nr:phage antirepressor KilAC domain-containing protein [Pelatocladus maniniholoensis HA4357-MV3]
MSAIMPFVYDGFEVRVVLIDDELWFVGKDVAGVLGYVKPENAIATHVDQEDKTTTPKQGGGFYSLINESGLYALVFGSRLESAKKFKKWVTSEVLPTIRKTGSYGKPKDLLVQLQEASKNEIIVKFLEAGIVIKNLQEEVEQKTQEVKQKEQKIEEQAPKVFLADQYISTDGLTTFTNFCKDLNLPVNKFCQYLRDYKYYYKKSARRGEPPAVGINYVRCKPLQALLNHQA